MRVDYEKLGVHREVSLKVDYAKLQSVPVPERKGIRADLDLLGVKRLPDDPGYSEILRKNKESVLGDLSSWKAPFSENLEAVLKELSSWRIPMRWPSFRWAYALVPAAGTLCLCLVLIMTGMPKTGTDAPAPAANVAVTELSTLTDTKNTYVGSGNTETVSVGQLVRTGTVQEDFEAAVEQEIGEAEPAEQGVIVSVLPVEEIAGQITEDSTTTFNLTAFVTGLAEQAEETEVEEPADSTEDNTENNAEDSTGTEQTIGEYVPEESEDEEEESGEKAEEEEVEEEPEPEIVMAAVSSQLNVRTEPSPDAEIAGALYADSGATVLEHGDGWTLIESGNLVGWASDEWLLTGDEAQAKLEEAGHEVVLVDTSTLNVRTEPTTESDTVGHLALGDEVEIKETEDEEWAEIEFNGKTAYINTNYTTVKLQYNTGDTVEEMKEKAEEKAKAAAAATPKKASANEAELSVGEAYDGSASELEMLATIIYCEAGNQPYEGKVAVGNVVLNRMASPSFPNDMNSVLRAPRQFSPVGSGKYDRMLNSGKVPESCYEAARDAMSGISFVGDCLYFKNPKIAGAHAGITIQDHVFW